MEILFMVFMVVVSIMALFAVMVVFRDVVSEVLVSRRERERADRSIIQHAERIIAEAEAKAAEAKAKAEAEPVKEDASRAIPTMVVEAPAAVAEPVAAPVVPEEPEVDETAAKKAESDDEAEDESDEGKISFALGQQQTLDEKYLALSAEQRGWYDAIIKYASAVEGSKRVKNARYEEYKVGKNRIVRLLIKRGVINCEFMLHNSDFKNYVNENKIAVKQSATTMLVETAATVAAVKNSIDIVVAVIAEEKEYKKQLARERRKAARTAKALETATEEK